MHEDLQPPIPRCDIVGDGMRAERQFRRVIGYRDLAKLATAVEHERRTPEPQPVAREEVTAALVTV